MKDKSQSPVPKPKNSANLLGFADAIQLIINGKTIRRQEWSNPEEYCLLKDNFLMIHRDDKFHQWIVSEGDLMAVDWVIIK